MSGTAHSTVQWTNNDNFYFFFFSKWNNFSIVSYLLRKLEIKINIMVNWRKKKNKHNSNTIRKIFLLLCGPCDLRCKICITLYSYAVLQVCLRTKWNLWSFTGAPPIILDYIHIHYTYTDFQFDLSHFHRKKKKR